MEVVRGRRVLLLGAQGAGDPMTAPTAPRHVRCPTLCDDDCEASCHEAHLPRHKREHDPAACPGNVAPTPERDADVEAVITKALHNALSAALAQEAKP